MAEKKKNTGQNVLRNRTGSQTSAPAKAQDNQKEQPAKSISAMARDERKEKERKEPAKKDTAKQEAKPVRRDTKGQPTFMARVRANRIGHFVLDAYYELRHKVTWPTFEEARNMTLIVIGLSLVIAAILGLADFGLQKLFFLVSGRGQ